MEGTVDILSVYRTPLFRQSNRAVPSAFLSRISIDQVVRVRSSQIHHNFNMQVAGCIRTDWLRGHDVIERLVVPGQVSLNVANELFECDMHPVEESIALHVVLPVDWFAAIPLENPEAVSGPARNLSLQPFLGNWDLQLRRYASRIVDALRASNPPPRMCFDEELLEIAVRIWNIQVDTLPAGGRLFPTRPKERLSRRTLTKAIEYMQEHLNQDIALDNIADQLGCSTWYFARAFRAGIGIPPWQYFRELRLIHARKILLETETPVTQLACDLGFGSASHFAAAFREETGYTPKQFRDLGQKDDTKR